MTAARVAAARMPPRRRRGRSCTAVAAVAPVVEITLAGRDDDVMLVSHDGDFLESVEPLLGGDRRVGLIAFEEFRNNGFTGLLARGMEFFDLERDTSAFNAPLPRLRIIPIEEFDPLQFL